MSFAGFKRCQTQFLAALGDPASSSGSGAERWGIWRLDPGPRGARRARSTSCHPFLHAASPARTRLLRDCSGERLQRFDQLAKDRRGRAGWDFTPSDFWIEEHGLIMEAPDIPIVPSTATGPRKFVVTGDREARIRRHTQTSARAPITLTSHPIAPTSHHTSHHTHAHTHVRA
jgi:hypothetical protein